MVPENHPSYTGFCGHPDCIAKQITAMCQRSSSWKQKLKLMYHLGVWEDFVSFITEQLLIEAGKGKPTIINFFWFRYKILTFLHSELKRGYAVMSMVPSVYRPEHQQVRFYDQFEQDVIDNEYEKFKEHDLLDAPERRAFNREVNEFVEERFGKEWVLFLNGEINRTDLSKLYHQATPKIRRLEKNVYRHLVEEFCDKERKDELWNSFGLDGETPLKQIIVHPIVDYLKKGKGVARKVEPIYWDTLADKINSSTGETTKDRAKKKKIAEYQQEIEKLKSTIRGTENVELKETGSATETKEPE